MSLCRLLLTFALLCTSMSCTATRHFLKAKPSPHTSFLKGDRHLRADPPDSGPFHYSARTMSMPAIKKDLAARAIWIAPVDISHLRPTATKLMASQERNGLHRPVIEMATQLWQSFRNAFNSPVSRYHVIDKPKKGCVELRLALVEFNQTNGAGNVVKTVATSFVGPFSMIAGPFVKGTIAIEGKMLVHGSGELLFEFADRESDPVTLFSVRSYQGTGFAEKAIEDWGKQCEQMTRMYQVQGKVRDSGVIRWSPF